MTTENEKETEMSERLRRRTICENIGESSTVSPPNYEVALDEIQMILDADWPVQADTMQAIRDILKAVNK